jgi:hypothetical protein
LLRKYGEEFYGALEAIAKGEHTDSSPE